MAKDALAAGRVVRIVIKMQPNGSKNQPRPTNSLSSVLPGPLWRRFCLLGYNCRMTKRVYITIVLLLIAVGLGVTILFQKQSPESSSIKDKSSLSAPVRTVDSKDTSAPRADVAGEAGRYEKYNQATLENAKGTRLLFFHAPWCSQCRKLDDDIKAKGVPQGVVILKVDYDSNQELRQKYDVTLQTTVVRIDGDGKLVKKYVAYDQPTLEMVRQQLLAQ